jgi:hypothetical protein
MLFPVNFVYPLHVQPNTNLAIKEILNMKLPEIPVILGKDYHWNDDKDQPADTQAYIKQQNGSCKDKE